MASENSVDRPPNTSEREHYSVRYDGLSKKVAVYFQGARFDLEGLYENYDAAMRAAEGFLRKRGVRP